MASRVDTFVLAAQRILANHFDPAIKNDSERTLRALLFVLYHEEVAGLIDNAGGDDGLVERAFDSADAWTEADSTAQN